MSDDNTNADASMQAPPKKSGRWVKWALVGSLAVNVLFIGFAASAAYKFSGHHWRDRAPIGQVMRQGRKFVRDLPRERRRELWSMIKQRRGEFRLDREEVDTAVREFAEALRETPYDKEALEAALMKLQDQTQELVTRGRDVTMDIISELSEDERRQLSDRLLEPRK